MSNQSLDDELLDILWHVRSYGVERGLIAGRGGGVVTVDRDKLEEAVAQINQIYKARIPKPLENPELIGKTRRWYFVEGYNACVKEMEEALGE